MCIENHHRWLYECTTFMKSHYVLHCVLCLQHLVSRWPQEFGRQCYGLNIPRYIQWISFAFSLKCLDTVLWVLTQESISSPYTILPGHVTRHQRRWRDFYLECTVIFATSTEQNTPATTWITGTTYTFHLGAKI